MTDLPHPYGELRDLHLEYGRRYDELRAMNVSEEEKRVLSGQLWFETNERRKELRKALPKGKRQCTATTKKGTRCSRPALADYYGQMCEAHAPHVSEW